MAPLARGLLAHWKPALVAKPSVDREIRGPYAFSGPGIHGLLVPFSVALLATLRTLPPRLPIGDASPGALQEPAPPPIPSCGHRALPPRNLGACTVAVLAAAETTLLPGDMGEAKPPGGGGP